MQAADVAESFDAASEPEGNRQATYRQLTLFVLQLLRFRPTTKQADS
jgi:hypothetical protein